MRLNESSQHYTTTLLSIGDGTFPSEQDNIEITRFATFISTREDLINHVWPDIRQITSKSLSFMSERAILAPLNSIVDEINKEILSNIEGQVSKIQSIPSSNFIIIMAFLSIILGNSVPFYRFCNTR